VVDGSTRSIHALIRAFDVDLSPWESDWTRFDFHFGNISIFLMIVVLTNPLPARGNSLKLQAVNLPETTISQCSRPNLVGRSENRHRPLWLMCALLVMTTFAVGAMVISQFRQAELTDLEREMDNLGTVLAGQTSRTIQSVDLVLKGVQARVSAFGVRSPEQFRLQLTGEATGRFLSGQLQNLSQAGTIIIVDSLGALLNWSRDDPVPAIDVSDRDYFLQMSSIDEPGVYISVPTVGRVTGKWMLFMARRINGSDGTFLGLVVALVDTGYLEDFYKTIGMVPGESVTVLRRDGIVIAGYPDIAHRRGLHMPDQSPWFDRVAKGGGTYRSPGYIGDIPSIVTVHPLSDYPLVVDVDVSEHAALQNWRERTAEIVAAMTGAALGFSVLFAVIAAQFGRQDIQHRKLIQSAAALRNGERRLKAYAEMSSDWFWEQDADCRYVRDSEIPLISLPSDVGRTRWDLADGTMNPDRWYLHKADLAANRPFRDFRWERIRTNGTRCYLSTSGDPIFDERGGFLGYHGTGRDITSEVVAKDRAEQAETLLRDAVNSMSDGFAIYDRADRFVMCNEAYRQIYTERAGFLVPGADFEGILRSGIANGGNLDSHGHEEEWLERRLRQHREADGTAEYRTGNGSCILVTDRRMENGGVAGLSVDITSLKQAQIALCQSERRLDRAQAIAGIGSWELDPATRNYIWSKELYRIRGFSSSDFKPTIDNVVPFVHIDDHLPMTKWLADLTELGEANACEMRAVRPDGSVRLLRVEGRAVIGPGSTRNLSGTMQDITDRRQIDLQLAQSQKMEAIGNLTGGMAHDFNNGLAVIIGNLDLLGRLLKADATASELCAEAHDGATRCAELIRQLLAFARRQPLHPHQIDVNELIENSARLLSRTLGGNITVTLQLGEALTPVVADPVQLEATLTNLANNARDAMPKGGRLHIATKMAELDAQYAALHPDANPGVYVLIEVGDAGVGIAPEIIGRIFEPFFTTKEMGRGTGLGLSMVFGFVTQSGGHLAVYSEPGLGTTFRIYLPPERAGDMKRVTPTVRGPTVGGDETVLVVEDNEALRRAAVRQLTELGYQVREAESAAAAMAVLCSEDELDLLFTDVVMPGAMDGLDLAYQATRLRPNLKILLTSGFPAGYGVDRHIESRPFRLLNKPYGNDELARTMREILDGRDTRTIAFHDVKLLGDP
jgi:signal transduction histidine kinase/ActR/RegA family two-component response regulator